MIADPPNPPYFKPRRGHTVQCSGSRQTWVSHAEAAAWLSRERGESYCKRGIDAAIDQRTMCGGLYWRAADDTDPDWQPARSRLQPVQRTLDGAARRWPSIERAAVECGLTRRQIEGAIISGKGGWTNADPEPIRWPYLESLREELSRSPSPEPEKLRLPCIILQRRACEAVAEAWSILEGHGHWSETRRRNSIRLLNRAVAALKDASPLKGKGTEARSHEGTEYPDGALRASVPASLCASQNMGLHQGPSGPLGKDPGAEGSAPRPGRPALPTTATFT
jgi:hypothetical protein